MQSVRLDEAMQTRLSIWPQVTVNLSLTNSLTSDGIGRVSQQLVDEVLRE